MPASTEEFTRQLLDAGLFSPADLQTLLDGLPPTSMTDGQQLARELVRLKKLTSYQARAIYQGQGKSLLMGNYLILDKLGQGGMGMVLKAEHKRMKRLVALKVLSPAVTKTPDAVRRFQREVEAAAKLEHPNIVSAYDADDANGIHFLVMQYVDGTDLSALVKTQGPLPVEKAAACITQAARGLEFAHQQGVIHRDIKPANLLIDAAGTVKILDMGLARIEGDTGAQAELTSTGAVMGTVDYMAPEQALSTKHADARSDVYSLGISLWYLLTGRCAYDGDSLMAKLLAHRDLPIPSLCQARAEIPPGVDAVFRKMVAKQAQDRYQSMTAAISDLQRCLAGPASSVSVNVVQRSENSEFNSFLKSLESPSTSTQAATRSQPRAASVAVDAAAEATMVGDGTEATDPQTLTKALPSATGLKSRHKRSQNSATSWWQDRRVHIGGGIGVLLVGLIWALVPPGKKGLPVASTKRSTAKESPKRVTTKNATSKDFKKDTYKEAVDWLFSVGAKVAVGPPGAVVETHSTAETLSSGQPVGYVMLGGKVVAEADMARLSALPDIHSLSLHGCDIGDQGMLPMADLPKLAGLDVSRTRVTDRGLEPLLKCPDLYSLHVNDAQITAEGLTTICRLSQLMDLNLGSVPITDQSLKQLQALRGLRSLDVSGCDKLTDECGAELARFPGLMTLYMARTSIGDRGLLGLSKTRSLKLLNLDYTELTDTSIPVLSQFKSLTNLHLFFNKLTADGVKQLATAMPWCEIDSDHGKFKPTSPVPTEKMSGLEFDGASAQVEIAGITERCAMKLRL